MSELPRYLHSFQSPHLDIITWQEMIASNQVLGLQFLIQGLKAAEEELTTTPGPNLTLRQFGNLTWIAWWLNFLGKLPTIPQDIVHSHKIMDIDKIGRIVTDNNLIAGELNLAGGEGTEGHRHAVNWIHKYTQNTILLFETPDYLKNKERGYPYLPPEARLSMWHYHPITKFIGIISQKPHDLSEKKHYQQIFDRTKATYSFATEEDPHLIEKIGRGKPADFLVIPRLPVLTTTNRVQRLLP